VSRRENGRTALLVVVALFAGVVGFVVMKQRARRAELMEREKVAAEAERQREAAREQRLAPFKGKTQDLFTVATAATEMLDNAPTLHGKLVVLRKDDPDKGEVDPIQLELDPAHVAASPLEVGTVIIIERGKEVAGKYEKTGSTGYRRTCDLTLVDVARKVVVARKHLTGDEPDATIKATGNHDVYGSDPTTTVVAWIDSLAAK